MLAELAKRTVYRTRGLNWLSRPRYTYCLDPGQLAFLVSALDKTSHLSGAVVEIGVARGMTTVFLNTHMSCIRDARPYVCIDTFSGFVPSDIDYELSHRGKPNKFDGFRYNDVEVFRKNVSQFKNVRVIQKDCNLLTAEDTGPVSLAILDVDLYLPTKHALSALYDSLQAGGFIMVDDVKPNMQFDGAASAYHEFCQAINLPPEVICNRAGIIRK
ncbi:MAG: TylF/MycF/NovP-related O-methyltransferase [Terriglobales bacterium]